MEEGNTNQYYFYVTFHSEKNVHKYRLSGAPVTTHFKNYVLVDRGEKIKGLRGMLVVDGFLYVANSHKNDSK